MSMKYVLSVIDQARDEWYKPPTTYYEKKRVDFDYQSLKRSAVDEIKFYLMEHEDQNPIDVIEEFRYVVDHLACNAQNGTKNFMFSIYYDVATDILDIVVGLNEKEVSK